MCYLASSMLTHQALGFSIRTPLLPLLLFFPSSPFPSLFSFTFLFYKAINERYHIYPLTTSLYLDLATPKQANLLIENGLVLGHRLHEVESFLADTVIAQYFKYFGYSYQARVCKNKAICGVYGRQHERRACSIPEQLLKPRCCNCQGSHLAWASICPKCQEVAKKAREV